MVDARADQRVFALNPGSTSTKIAVFSRDGVVSERSVAHDREQLGSFATTFEQLAHRQETIVGVIDEIGSKDIVAVVGRGGLLRPLPGGIYAVGDDMLADLRAARYGDHASNLGAPLAKALADRLGVPAFIADPVTTDELVPEARLSGLPEIVRLGRGHALNTKACARQAAGEIGRPVEALRFVVAHLGGGITVAAVDGGRMLDVNDALHGMGPFSPERAGALPIGGLVKLAFSGRYREGDLLRKLAKGSGLVAYLGTNDVAAVCARAADGDAEADLVLRAMIHQIAKEIGAMAAVLRGRIDGVILTGGVMHNARFVEELEERIGFLGRLFVYPGENELRALASAGFRAVDGTEAPKRYERE